ncbi:Type 1 glutamine amidotransferase-like domain-containing protein [Actinomadura sp. DC4]|uniref:Type 1 glutamine amidotransferase-like domain-containing protein n=1 Tax=Actinomadura sp. DC4 TaxID=3055069 RepID=UPI0025B10E67|nr:Type 1 glutamine amidotransferase-like domain-containing protein [Actinomadura sp. DC4]MDN3351177.1 Type 1 glutamine amidotransferase-like domain-containing protein [Actinomadura sp. DC4]
MRLYLSSYRLGDEPERLTALLRTPRPAAVVANAVDMLPADLRAEGVAGEVTALAGLGLTAEEVDLRAYFGQAERLAADLERYELVWFRGGNTFVLRAALALSGGDRVLADLVRADTVVWGGYSAGCCVLAPSLRGIEQVDDPGAVLGCYGTEPVWDGLGLVEYAIVPHYRSGHPESAAVELLAARYRTEETAHRTLRDGEAIVVGDGRAR